MEKLLLCFCFTWIVFIEPNFIVAFLLIRKLGMADLPVRGDGEGGGGQGGMLGF